MFRLYKCSKFKKNRVVTEVCKMLSAALTFVQQAYPERRNMSPHLISNCSLKALGIMFELKELASSSL